MGSEVQKDQQEPQARKGQTLVEFMITLPLLLVLMFGIIEFGRIFQAWISIQNAARVAARYASTGQYFDEFGDLVLNESLENGTNDSQSIVPCHEDDRSGASRSFRPAEDYVGHVVRIYEDQRAPNDLTAGEALFRTWWGHECEPFLEEIDPTDPDNIIKRVNAVDQFLRLDLLRIPSIYASAIQGAGGLAINPMPIEAIIGDYDVEAHRAAVEDGDDTTNINNEEIKQVQLRLTNFLYSVWHPIYPMHPNLDISELPPTGIRGYLDEDEPSFSEGELDSYFLVTMCSNRPVINENATVFIGMDESDPRDDKYRQRFAIPVYEPGVVFNDQNEPDNLREWVEEMVVADGDLYNQFTDMPACFLNEEFAGQENEMVRWIDPGGPGNTVELQVTFYHPLITPLGLARFIPMHARRSAVVESFYSTTSQTGALGGEPLPDSELTELAPDTPTPSDTPVPTNTFTPTYTPSPTTTPSVTPTVAEAAFECADVSFVRFNTSFTGSDQEIGFNPGSVTFIFENTSNSDARLISTDLHWTSEDYATGVTPDPVPGYSGFFFDEFELGGDTQWNGSDFVPNTDTTSAEDPGALPVELTIPANSQIRFEAKFQSGPTNLGNLLPLAAFDGTTFRIRDTLTLEECPPLVFESDTTDNVDPDLELQCDTGEVVFASSNNALQQNGWVQLFVTNSKDAPVTIDGFDITWGPWEDRYQGDSTRTLALQRVYVGGDTPPQGTLLWSSSNGNNGTGIVSLTNNEGTLDDPNIYTTVSEDDGTWAGPYTIPANATLNFWLDFTGNDLTDDDFGFLVSDLNASTIDVNCDDIDEEDIGFEDVPSPEPTVPTATPLPNDNQAPIANDDEYDVSDTTTVFSISNPNTGLLVNDTDCADTSFVAANSGSEDPCTPADAASGDPARFTDSGDNPLEVNNCQRNVTTTQGASVTVNCDGTFDYDPTEADPICEASNITDTFTYQAEDSRNADSNTALVTFNINNSATNTRPEAVNNNDILVVIDTRNGLTFDAPSDPNSNQNLNYLFNDDDGDTLSFTKTGGVNWVTVNADGSWSVNVPASVADGILDGETSRRTITVEADDGNDICSTQTNRFRIEIIGRGEEPPTPLPTNTPPPTNTFTPVPPPTQPGLGGGG